MIHNAIKKRMALFFLYICQKTDRLMKRIYALLLLAIAPAMHSQNMTLDTTFGIDGKTSTLFPPSYGGETSSHSSARDVLIQNDGKIVTAGTRSAGSGTEFGLARFSANGIIDPTFGTNGMVTTDFINPPYTISSNYDAVNAISLQTDGKIIAVGNTTNYALYNTLDVALARYNTNGSLDTSFGVGGKVFTDFDGRADSAMDVAIQPDGKIVIVGKTGFVNYSSNPAISSNNANFIIARYNTNGTIDNTFGTSGKVILPFGLTTVGDFGKSLVILSNGKLLIGGLSGLNFALARLNTNGALDTTFGTNGKVLTDFNTFGSNLVSFIDMTVQEDGKILAAGSKYTSYDAGDGFALVRYNADGSLDTDFATGGFAYTEFNYQDDVINKILIQSDSKILAVGYGAGTLAFARFDTNGMPDSTFGYSHTGKEIVYPNYGAASAIMQGDKVVTTSAYGSNMTLARYNISDFLKVSENTSSDFQIFPNPVKTDYLQVSKLTSGNYRIVNLLGQEVGKGDFSNGRIPVANVKTGTYVIEISSEDQKTAKRFIRQ